jgi:hypothetical protein
MTPHDWAQLSEWIDGGLSGEAKTEFEARLQREPELAEAARRLKTLADTARTLTPTPADTEAWKKTVPRSLPLGPILGVLLLLVAAGTGLLMHGPESASASGNDPTDGTTGGPTSPPPAAGNANSLTSTAPTDAPPADDMNRLTITDAGTTTERPPPSPDASVPVRDAGAPSPGATPMPFRPDASTPLVVAALVATAAQAGPPPTVHVNPGEPWLVHAPRSEVTVSPQGVADVRAFGPNMTRILSKEPATLRVTTSPSDGGTPVVVDLDVSAKRDPEFTIPLDVGSSRHIWAPGRVRFTVGSSATAQVTEDGDRLEVRGVQAGETSVEAWFSDGAHLTWPVRVTAKTDDQAINLRVGRQIMVSVPAGQKLRLEDPALARVQPIGNKQVLLVGMRPGTTSLITSEADGGTTSRRPVVVTGAPLDEEPASVETVSITPSPAQQGPWRVRQNRALRFTSTAHIARVRTATELVLTSLKDNAVLVRGAAPGRAVIEIGFDDGAEVAVTIVVDP